MRILLADGQVQVRSALRVLLRFYPGAQVVGEAVDGDSLAAELEATQPDLLLLDWGLSGAHPHEALSALRQRYPHVRVIVMSGQPEIRGAALAAGAHAFISKGDPPEQLLDTLRMIGEEDVQ